MFNEFTTEKGTKLYWEVTYSKGGYNHFTSNFEKRGYSLSVRRKKNVFTAFSGLSDESGAVSLFLHEVGRKSTKQLDIALDMVTEELLNDIATRYGI